MMQETFSEEVKQIIIDAQFGICKNCNCQIHSIHHKLKNAKYNRKKFILFIHSPFNGIGLCFKCHRDKSHLFRITEKEAQMYENYLQGLKNEK